jgi:hypothetical protein
MATPNISDLILFSDHPTNPLNDLDWQDNFTQIVNWLTDGTADITVRSVTLSAFSNLPKYANSAVAGIVGMTEGSMIMNTDTHRPMFFDGEGWQTL